ncbi:polysaccharide pyruvyl transferase CsaB [Bacillus shivajii]|uniref:polysaccharide pyruvyl transferase CsaB n=1 Tax=Bacillus shivajii TaxID=1983719 RepID=UPI001CFB6804|nr:polysaccharide pyruvyl transferase CsaB [Bacillus shivajii]UCZ51441.1 polysaccharide pyruvyl transferase CsaB [Bacillus shivajii]
MNIVISGYYGFDNVGDEAILYSIIQELKQDFPSITITVLSNQPEKTTQIYGVNAVNRWNFKAVFTAIKKSDGIISGGGGLLQDSTGIKGISYYCGIMWIAHLCNKPFFVYAQGIGPIKFYFNKKIVSHTLSKASLITVRDDHSKKVIQELGVKKDIDVVADPVLGMKLEERYSKWLQSMLKDDTFISIAVRYWRNSETFLGQIASGLSPIAESGIKLVFVPMHGSEDYSCSNEVVSRLSKTAQKNSFIAPHDLSIQEKASIIGSSQMLLGMRLHSLIFAAINSVPFASISYDPKVEVFTKVCGQKLIGQVDDDKWDSSDITNEIEKYQELYPTLQENLLAYTKEAKSSTEMTAISVLKQILMNKSMYHFR